MKALRYRGFRLLWASLFLSAVGTWMQIVAQALLVLRLTNGSAFALGTVSLAQALSFFVFGLAGGAFADKYDKRRLLLTTQTLLMLLAACLGCLTLFGVVRLWMIVATAFCSGAILSFDQPTRGALIPRLVPPEALMNAISLQSTIFSGAATFGPALAGFALRWIGYAGNFFLNAVSYLAVIVTLLCIHIPAETEKPRAPFWDSVRMGLAAVGRDSVLPRVFAGYGALLFLGPSPAVMLPIFAVKVLRITPPQMGLLFACVGVGAIAGGLLIASLGDVRRKEVIFTTGMIVWSCALGLFAASTVMWLSMAALVLLGASQNAAGSVATTLMQTRVAPQMRGRVMSLNTLLIMGVRPLGDFPAGALIAAVGGPLTAGLSAAVVGLYALGLAATNSKHDKLSSSSQRDT
jgi:MFS family permease